MILISAPSLELHANYIISFDAITTRKFTTMAVHKAKVWFLYQTRNPAGLKHGRSVVD
jgi:hypothetical protein